MNVVTNDQASEANAINGAASTVLSSILRVSDLY